jgi:hypothetical protein
MYYNGLETLNFRTANGRFRMTKALETKEKNPLEDCFRHRKYARYEIDSLRNQSDEAILAKARSVHGFKVLEEIYSFRIDRSNPDTLQLGFGMRPMGGVAPVSRLLALEDGPVLLYSLAYSGYFLTILYPAKSDIHNTFEDHLFLQIGETSSLNLINTMKSDLRLLVAYAHTSSIDMKPTLRERVSVELLRLFASRGEKGQFKKPPVWSGFLVVCVFGARVITMASISAMVRPLGIAIVLMILGYFGFGGLRELVVEFLAKPS